MQFYDNVCEFTCIIAIWIDCNICIYTPYYTYSYLIKLFAIRFVPLLQVILRFFFFFSLLWFSLSGVFIALPLEEVPVLPPAPPRGSSRGVTSNDSIVRNKIMCNRLTMWLAYWWDSRGMVRRGVGRSKGPLLGSASCEGSHWIYLWYSPFFPLLA